MRVHYISTRPIPKKQVAQRSTIGGSPILPAEHKWPHCRLCKERMLFFFQFDVQKIFDLPLKSLSHFAVFMCPVHNDVPTQLVESDQDQLPEQYWDKTFGHYFMMLFKPGKPEDTLELDPVLVPKVMSFEPSEEEIDWDGKMERGTPGFKVGGVPDWVGNSQYTRCACGAEMVFVCQLPPHFSFATQETAQAPSVVPDDKCTLFLGRPTFFFACKEQCSPYALYAVGQDLAEELAESA